MEQGNGIGAVVKARRQEMSLTLKEVENATSIRINYLRAIEEGDVEGLISPIYAEGFVKQYATFLGMDGERLIADHPMAFGVNPKQEFTYGIGTLEVRGSPASSVKWLPNALWMGISLFTLLCAWALARYLEVI